MWFGYAKKIIMREIERAIKLLETGEAANLD